MMVATASGVKADHSLSVYANTITLHRMESKYIYTFCNMKGVSSLLPYTINKHMIII